MTSKKKLELVFIPASGVGHHFAAIEVAKSLSDQNEQLSIAILFMKTANVKNPISASSCHPRIRFIELRKDKNASESSDAPFMIYFDFVDWHKTHVREILGEITSSDSTSLAGVVVDMMCASMIDVANEFGVPSYVFFASNAAMLGLTFHLQSLRDESHVDVTEYKDSDEEVLVPSYINPVPAKVLPSIFFYKDGACDAFLNQAKRYRETKGILINTFEDLESHALQALSDDETIPPVYPIGPILKLDGIDNQEKETEAIIKWLDLQPVSSVFFFCFGSMGSFLADQVKEIARAIEKSGCRFLWSLRKPQLEVGYEQPSNYENPEEVLPEGFLQRTAEVGKVMGWAPQAAVLAHPSVGGFVTHSGWNSILESVWNGVPMATWPIYAEQQVNAFLMVKDLELAAEIKMDYRKENEATDIVSAETIENGIKQLMDSGNEIRSKMKEMKEKSRSAITEGGSSSASLSSFLKIVVSELR